MVVKRCTPWIVAGFMLLLLIGPPGGSAQVIDSDTATARVGAATALDGGGLSKPTVLTGKEGGNAHSAKFERVGQETRINATTFIVLSPGANRIWGTSDDGVVHCFGVGTAGQGCEFLTTGPLPHDSDDAATEVIAGLNTRFFSPSVFDVDQNGTAETNEFNSNSNRRAPIRVNLSTAVVVGAGDTLNVSKGGSTLTTFEVAALCEDGTSAPSSTPHGALAGTGGAYADDSIHILRGLGAAGASVETITGFCLGTFAADPVRLNRDTIIFGQPGADGFFHDSQACDDVGAQLTKDDEIVVIRGLFTAAVATVETLNVGADLGVFLSGGPAARAVRVTKGTAVFASPGADGEFADTDPAVFPGTSENGTCGLTTVASTAEDDGLVLVQGLGEASPGAFLADFVVLGRLSASPMGRPTRVNGTPGTVVVVGTGPSHTFQEQEFIANGLIDPTVDDPQGFADEEIIVAQCLTQACLALPLASTVVTTLGGDLGYMIRPIRLRQGVAVAFEEESALSEDEEGTRLRIQIATGLGSVVSPPALAALDVPTGDAIAPGTSTGVDQIIRMNNDQILFMVTGPPQVISFTFHVGDTPFLSQSGGAPDDWAAAKLVRANDGAAVYTTAKQGAFGALRLDTQTGVLKDHRLGLAGGDESDTDGHGAHHPASTPVRLTDEKVVILVTGSNNSFAQECDSFTVGPPPVCTGSGLVKPALGADDGMWVIDSLLAGGRPTTSFITTGGNCGGPGCRPLRLSETALVMVGPGANGQFDANDDDCFNQDSSGGCDGANGGTGVLSVDDTLIFGSGF